jgi:hypothetical protein
MRVRYIRSSSMRKRCHPVPCWSYLETTLRTLLVLPEDDLLPNGIPCRLQSRCTLLDRPKPVSSGLNAVFRQVVTSGLRAVFHQGVTSGLKAIFHPTQGGGWNQEKGTGPYKKPGIATKCTRNGRRAIDRSAHTSPWRGRRTQSRGKGQAEWKGGGREDPGPRNPTAGETRQFTAIGQRVRRKPKEPRARGKGGVTMLQALGETPAKRGTLCLPMGVLYAYQVGYGPLPYFGEWRRPMARGR